MMAARTSSRCDACGGDVGLWQAGFTSECAHNFHLRCVSESAACPVCAATWKDTPATATAATPATPFSFASTSMFGPASTAPANSSSASTMAGVFGQRPQKPANSPLFNFLQAPPASTPPPSQPSDSESSPFGQKQATSNPFWLAPAAPDAQSSAPAAQSPPSSCSFCSAAMGRGQATVTSECGHTFHLGCFSGSVCAICDARWREEVTVTLSPSCTVCGGAMGRGKAATVTSECGHAFHLRCISGSVCPACGARWRDEVTVTLVNPSSSPSFSSPSFGFTSYTSSPAIRAPVPSSAPSFSAAHNPSPPPNSAPSTTFSTPSFATPNSSFSSLQPPLFSRSADSTSAPATPSSLPNFAPPSSSPSPQQPSLSSSWSFGSSTSFS